MIESEVLSLLKIVQNLAGKKAQLDQKYFDQFIEPIWLKFVEIHNNYKTTFQSYSGLVREHEGNMMSLIERIRQDSMYSEDLRVELRGMVKHVPYAVFPDTPKQVWAELLHSISPKSKRKYMEVFFRALGHYFELRSSSIKVAQNNEEVEMIFAPRFANKARYRVITILSRNGIASNPDQVTEVLQDTIRLLQTRYEAVSNAYYQLKKELLT